MLDCKADAALDQVDRIPPELLEPPPGQDFQILAHAGRKRFELVADGRSASPPPRPRFERILSNSLSRSLTSAPSLVRPGPARFAVGQLVGLERLGAGERIAISRAADVVVAPARGQARGPGPRSSWVLGGWSASSPSVSSLTIRPRGRFFDRASVSRHAASAFRRPSTAGLRLGSLSRFHASSGVEREARRVGEPLHLLVEPVAAAGSCAVFRPCAGRSSRGG